MSSKAAFRGRLPRSPNFRDLCQDLLGSLASDYPPLDACKFGRTMVLYRAEPHRILEMLREQVSPASPRRRCCVWDSFSLTSLYSRSSPSAQARNRGCRVAQRLWRGHVGRKFFMHLLSVRLTLREAIASRDLDKVTAAAEVGAKQRVQLFEMKEIRRLKKVLLEERLCREELKRVLDLDPVDHFESYQKSLQEAERLQVRDSLDFCRASLRFALVCLCVSVSVCLCVCVCLSLSHVVLLWCSLTSPRSRWCKKRSASLTASKTASKRSASCGKASTWATNP